MKKFVFRMQIVLDRTLKEEERLLQQLSQLRGEMARKEQEIADNGNQRHMLMLLMAERQQGIFDPQDIHMGHLQLEALGNDLMALFAQRNEIGNRIAAKQAEVVETMRKRQVLEKLREKQHTAYIKEIDRLELQNMEESVLPRLARKRSAEQAALCEQTIRTGGEV